MTNAMYFIPKFTHAFPNLSGYNKMKAAVEIIKQYFRDIIDEHIEKFDASSDSSPADYIDAYIKEMKECSDPNSGFYKQRGSKTPLKLYSIFTELVLKLVPVYYNWSM